MNFSASLVDDHNKSQMCSYILQVPYMQPMLTLFPLYNFYSIFPYELNILHSADLPLRQFQCIREFIFVTSACMCVIISR